MFFNKCVALSKTYCVDGKNFSDLTGLNRLFANASSCRYPVYIRVDHRDREWDDQFVRWGYGCSGMNHPLAGNPGGALWLLKYDAMPLPAGSFHLCLRPGAEVPIPHRPSGGEL